MPVKINMKGLDKLKKKFEDLHGQHKIGLSETLTPEFLTECSDFYDINQFFNASGFKVESPEDFKAIPDNEWEEFIVNNTTFESWEAMQKAALDKHVKSKIFNALNVR